MVLAKGSGQFMHHYVKERPELLGCASNLKPSFRAVNAPTVLECK
jgi:hypothetical protein